MPIPKRRSLPDLRILDDLGLHRLTPQQSADLYQLILNRHWSSSFVITSNRAVDEWLSLFDDPTLGNSALDRLANASYQIVIEGASHRERLSPHHAVLSARGGDLPGTTKLILIKIATRPGWYIVLGDHWLNVRGVSHLHGSDSGITLLGAHFGANLQNPPVNPTDDQRDALISAAAMGRLVRQEPNWQIPRAAATYEGWIFGIQARWDERTGVLIEPQGKWSSQ